MEESKALQKLIEAADLVGMVEDLLSPASSERLSASAWSGLRITLRNVKDTIQGAHSKLAADLVQRSRSAIASGNGAGIPAGTQESLPSEAAARTESRPVNFQISTAADAPRIQMTRKDLKASLEKFIER